LPVKKHLQHWGAAYLLFALFCGSWLGQFVAQTIASADEARSHGQEFSWSDFWPQFFSTTFENWQSEWLQLFVQAAVLLGMKHLIFKADAADLERLHAKVDRLLEEQGIDPAVVEAEAEQHDSSSAARRAGR
jgi:hypothetical protein